MAELKIDILEQSRNLFQRFGYHKTTLTDIAKSVGKVKTAIYYYFNGKEEIFAELVQQEAEQFYSKLRKAVNKETSTIAKLETYVDTRIQLMQKISTRYSFLKQEFFELMPIVEENRKDAHAREIAFVTTILEKGISEQSIRCNQPQFTAELLVNSLKGLEIQMYVTDTIVIDTENSAPFRSFILYGAIHKNETTAS